MKLVLETTKSGKVVVAGIGLGEGAPSAAAPAPKICQETFDCKKLSMSK